MCIRDSIRTAAARARARRDGDTQRRAHAQKRPPRLLLPPTDVAQVKDQLTTKRVKGTSFGAATTT
eukprot:995515-Prymnesium_polylepis.1